MAVFDKTQNLNKVSVRGRVVSDRIKNKRRILTIVSKIGNNEVYTPFEGTDETIPDHNFHGIMCVNGHLESRRVKRGGREVAKTFFVADEVKEAKTITEEVFGIEGKFFEKHSTDVFLNGIVVGVQEEDDWLFYTIHLGKIGKRDNTARISAKKQDRHLNVKVGDRICACCKIKSALISDAEHTDKKVPVNSIIVNDMAIVQ